MKDAVKRDPGSVPAPCPGAGQDGRHRVVDIERRLSDQEFQSGAGRAFAAAHEVDEYLGRVHLHLWGPAMG
ncbi:MAG: hypothetical protein ACKVQR_20440 [Aquabacterium sp.]